MAPAETRHALLQAALYVFRAQGYAATTVEQLCRAAGVSKGAFFHHWPSKEALALAAIEHWNQMTGALFAEAPYQREKEPRAWVLAYLDFRLDLIGGQTPDWTCLLGTLLQECFQSHPALAAAAGAGIEAHVQTLVGQIESARLRHAPDADWDAADLARSLQAGLQGAFIMAKAGGGAPAAKACVRYLRRHVELLLPDQPFGVPT